MSKSNAWETAYLKLLLNGTPITGIADNAASSPLTSLYLSLHTADPGETGTQTTNEISYTGYARVAVARTTGGWTVDSSGIGTLVAAANFGASTGGTGGTASFACLGTAATGAGMILYSGAISPTISVTSGVTPQIAAGTTITED